ncbi:MAG: hypothetical protein ACRCVW_06875, partial [Brevinema sp.]
VALLVGTSSLGTVNKAITIGKTSDISKILGYGSLPNIIRDMQLTMVVRMSIQILESLELHNMYS